MMQYLGIKEQNKDAIVMFRLGDFYEMFFDDAIIVSKELELALTGKNAGAKERVPMCGVPFHIDDLKFTCCNITKSKRINKIKNHHTCDIIIFILCHRFIKNSTWCDNLNNTTFNNTFFSRIC